MNTNYFVDEKNPEWHVMWQRLAALEINKENADPTFCYNDGEAWQYMGSSLTSKGTWVHCFRHRLHPKTDSRVYFNIPASEEFAKYLKDLRLPKF
jgi:hypothetical protein